MTSQIFEIDLVANSTMAKLGFASMGVSACFGAPVLSGPLFSIDPLSTDPHPKKLKP